MTLDHFACISPVLYFRVSLERNHCVCSFWVWWCQWRSAAPSGNTRTTRAVPQGTPDTPRRLRGFTPKTSISRQPHRLCWAAFYVLAHHYETETGTQKSSHRVRTLINMRTSSGFCLLYQPHHFTWRKKAQSWSEHKNGLETNVIIDTGFDIAFALDCGAENFIFSQHFSVIGQTVACTWSHNYFNRTKKNDHSMLWTLKPTAVSSRRLILLCGNKRSDRLQVCENQIAANRFLVRHFWTRQGQIRNCTVDVSCATCSEDANQDACIEKEQKGKNFFLFQFLVLIDLNFCVASILANYM